MTLPGVDTLVTYPTGQISGFGTVLHVEPVADGRTAVLLDATCCHPVDAGWPDQGPDRAVLVAGEREYSVVDCVVGATDGQALHLGADIPVSKGSEGWAFVVAHLVEGGTSLAEGDRVEQRVDADHRLALSAGHTGCHLAALALNRAMADRWRKEVRPDGVGSPDFDQAANASSVIRENGSIDTYRLGKSLRKKGFTTDGLAEALADVGAAVNQTLGEWTASASTVRIDRDGEGLTDRRYWVCELADAVDGEVRIPCGGTHLGSTAELVGLSATLSLADVDGTPVLTMETTRAL
ncbi:metal-dependent hydrolase [Homoserinimonas sp. OAct 916]|uniref:metal-dependent hydrolase n=1 Tax=Homoserinimonas sp. OAct 916 TaxID=2211450 RepID=UPI000DBE67F5|nr:metal-dependent hydrolase [Homoserinimonas sp. OAct 916]